MLLQEGLTFLNHKDDVKELVAQLASFIISNLDI